MKNGFTLIELLVVIAILAVLVIITVPSIANIRDNILEKSLKSINDRIMIASEDWAYDNIETLSIEIASTDSNNAYGKCTYILVNELIIKGYLVGDKENKTILNNPVTNQSMNDLEVCVRYKYKLKAGVADYNNRTMETMFK